MTVRARTTPELVEDLEMVRRTVAETAAFLRRAMFDDQYVRRHAIDLEDTVPILDDAIGNLRVDRTREVAK